MKENTQINRCAGCGAPTRHLTCSDECRERVGEFHQQTRSMSSYLSACLSSNGVIDTERQRSVMDIIMVALDESMPWQKILRSRA